MSYKLTVTDISWERVLLSIKVKAEEVPDAASRVFINDNDENEGEYPDIHDEPVDDNEYDDNDNSRCWVNNKEAYIEKYGHLPESGFDFRLSHKSGSRSFPLETKKLDDNLFLLTMNITNISDRKAIPNGVWVISDEVSGAVATVDLDLVDYFDNHSRVYLYDRNTVAFTVSFGLTEDEIDPLFLIRVYVLHRRGGKPKPAIVAFFKSPGKYLRKKRHQFIHSMINNVYQWCNKFIKKRGDRILFASESRSKIEGNLLCIRDRMLERGLDKKFKFYYSFRMAAGGPQSLSSWIKLVYKLGICDYVLVDDYCPLFKYINFRPETKIIQVWHAGVGFKSVGYSRFGNLGSPKLNDTHRKYTYALAGSKHLVEVYAEAFGIERSAVIPTGLPRVDAFLRAEKDENLKKEFFSRYPQLANKKRILFAPTFRGRGKKTAYYNYEKIDFAKLYDFCKDEYVVLFKMHHFVDEPVPVPGEFKDRLYDFSGYPDLNNLLYITDILITDYSSIIYEFSLLRRPMLFFAYDKKPYSVIRGFHRDYDSYAPGKICETFDKLLQALENKDYELEKIDRFVEESFDYKDANSTDRVIDWLILGNLPDEFKADKTIMNE